MLILPIKKHWFDMIKNGTKHAEYRDIKPYYNSRFKPFMNGEPFQITLRNGYSKQSDSIVCTVKLSVGIGNFDWGADHKTPCYILSILEILK